MVWMIAVTYESDDENYLLLKHGSSVSGQYSDDDHWVLIVNYRAHQNSRYNNAWYNYAQKLGGYHGDCFHSGPCKFCKLDE